MKKIPWLLTACLTATGCLGLTGERRSATLAPPPPSETPSPERLVSYLQANAARMDGLECTDLALEVKAGMQEGGLNGTLHCQKPRDFRLRAKALGQQIADFGSNDQEFWYWIKQDNPPYLYHCSYADLATGQVKLQLPFQPDWVMEVLGLSPPAGDSSRCKVVRVDRNTIELIESTKSLDGQPVNKVTVFNAATTSGAEPQVKAHRLTDSAGKLICQATVTSVRRDPATGATVPHSFKLEWPAQKLEMRMKLDGLTVHVNRAVAQKSPQLFIRQPMRDIPAYDLARNTLDGRPSSTLRQARGQ